MMQQTHNRIAWSRILALGVLLALMAAGMLLAARPAHASTPFTVTNTNDSGAGSLRQAIMDANNTTGADVIDFDIPGTGVATIAPTSQLPTITGPVTINGYSQPGAEPNAKAVGSDAVLKIELSGASAVNGYYGLVMGASNSTVKGLVINRWSRYGIRVDGANATGNKITGNYIGTDASGTQSLGNELGIRIYDGSYNTIGGATPASRNIISGNEGGVSIGDGGPNVTGNRVAGNYIGTDVTGTKDLGNGSYGVSIEDVPETKSNTIIGGATAGERNVISGNDGSGVDIFGIGNKVAGNFIGTDATGTKDLGNTQNGVDIGYGSNNTIGGTTAAERNVISGNNRNGVAVEGPDANGNRVVGNYLGTDKNGTAPLGNDYNGVSIGNAPDNVVGGATAGARNVISANKVAGVNIYSAAMGNKVAGNYVGTDASGTRDLGNGFNGVWIYDASDNTIGGTTAGERNVISANDGNGVLIYGLNATGNKVMGNYVGTDKYGAAALGNSANGVYVSYSSNNTVGGTTAGARNVISANEGSGVSIYGAGTTGNRVLSNSIFANGGLGIDLGDDGPTANDAGDADAGPNYLQNHPVLSSARKNAAGTTTIRGKLNSVPDATFKVQIFSNPKGTDEGKTLLGSQTVFTDGSGEVTFAFSTNKEIRLGQNITATATGPGGNTSEFSAPKQVVAS